MNLMTRLSIDSSRRTFGFFASLSILTSLYLKVSQASRDMEALYIPRYVCNEKNSCAHDFIVIEGYLPDFTA